MITKDNYQIYALDYLEGNLTEEEKKEFENFLSKNPDIKDEIMSLMDVPIVPMPDKETFSHKHTLKKSSVSGLTYTEELIISDIEGIISQKQKAELNKIISQDQKAKKEYEIYKKTRLAAPQIYFPSKSSLKKNIITFSPIIRNALAYAAIVLLFLSIFSLIKKPEKQVTASIQLLPGIEQIIILTPADQGQIPVIDRPVIAQSHKDTIINKKNTPTVTHPVNNIHTKVASAQTEDKITPRTFDVKPIITHSITMDNSLPNETFYVTLANISTQAKDKFSTWLKKKGIQVSRREFVVKINDKAYGIAVAGK